MIDSNDCENWSFSLDVILSGNVFEMQRDEKMMFSSKINDGIWNRRWINFFINLDEKEKKIYVRMFYFFVVQSQNMLIFIKTGDTIIVSFWAFASSKLCC